MIKFSVIRADKPVCKSFHVDGSKTSCASIPSGEFTNQAFKNLDDFGKVLDRAQDNMAITTGVFPIAKGKLTTVDYEDIADGSYARTLDNVKYTEEGKFLILLDNDPHPDGRCFATAQEYLQYLLQLHPLLKELEILVRPSSSAGIRVNGSLRSPYSGWHAYITADAGVQVRSVKQWLESLCWKAGDGYIMLTKVGAMLPRCTFDLAVFSPERLIFIAAPKLDAGVTQDHIGSVYQKGRSIAKADKLDYDNQLPKLIEAAKKEQTLLDKQKVIQEAYVKEKVQQLVKTTKKTAKECEVIIRQTLQLKGIYYYLPEEFEVTKVDGNVVTIKQLMAAGNNEAIADPFEGLSYGRTTAKYYHNKGRPVINSLAHGGYQCRVSGVQYVPDVATWWDKYAMNAEGRYVSLEHPTAQPYSRTAFDNKHFNEPELWVEDKFTLPSVFVMGLLPTIDATVYNPLKSERTYKLSGLTVLNTYVPHVHVGFTGSCSQAEKLIKAHLKHLFADEKEQSLMLDWMAHQIQKPGQLLRFAPLLVGVQGDGKTTISNIVIAAIGSNNAVTASNTSLESAFNGWANDGALCCIEELKSAGKDKHRIYNELKTFLTNQFIPINRKGINQITVENVTNYFACSNHKDALPLEQGDRRWWIMFTNWVDHAKFDGVAHASYFDQLYAFINSPLGAAEVHKFLSQHPISSEFSCARSAPVSASKKHMLEASYDDDVLALDERLKHYGDRLECTYKNHTCINVTKLQGLERNNQQTGAIVWENPTLPTGTKLSSAMNSLGYVAISGRPLIDKTKSSLYRQKV